MLLSFLGGISLIIQVQQAKSRLWKSKRTRYDKLQKVSGIVPNKTNIEVTKSDRSSVIGKSKGIATKIIVRVNDRQDLFCKHFWDIFISPSKSKYFPRNKSGPKMKIKGKFTKKARVIVIFPHIVKGSSGHIMYHFEWFLSNPMQLQQNSTLHFGHYKCKHFLSPLCTNVLHPGHFLIFVDLKIGSNPFDGFFYLKLLLHSKPWWCFV